MHEYMSEQEQWELVKAWLRAHGPWIVAGLVAGALALGGMRWWEAYTEQRALAAAALYDQIVETFGRGERARGLSLVDELKREHPSSAYAQQADLLAARVFVESNELDRAAARLRSVMEESDDRELALIARLRLARVQLAQGKPDEALATLGGASPGAFEPRFREVRGDIYVAKGDGKRALEEYRAARAADVAALVDTELLDLKINDLLAADGAASAPATASAAEVE